MQAYALEPYFYYLYYLYCHGYESGEPILSQKSKIKKHMGQTLPLTCLTLNRQKGSSKQKQCWSLSKPCWNLNKQFYVGKEKSLSSSLASAKARWLDAQIAVIKKSEQIKKGFLKSKPLLCWHGDVHFLNLRHWFFNSLRAMHLLWTITKNNGRVVFIHQSGFFDIQAHQNMVDDLMQSLLRPSLKREAFTYFKKKKNHRVKQVNALKKPVHRSIGLKRGKPRKRLQLCWAPQALKMKKAVKARMLQLASTRKKSVHVEFPLPLLSRLIKTEFGPYSILQKENRTHKTDQTKSIGKPRYVPLLQKARLWMRLCQLSSRLATSTYGAVKSSWFSNNSVSNSVFHPLALFDRKSKAQNLRSLSGGINRLNRPFAKTFWLCLLPLLIPFKRNQWFKPQLASASIKAKEIPSFLDLNRSERNKRNKQKRLHRLNHMYLSYKLALHFTKSITKSTKRQTIDRITAIDRITTYNKGYLQNFYEAPLFTYIKSPLSLTSPLSFSVLSNQQLAKNMLLGQINAVVFSNGDRSAKLVQQARNLNIPTIGLCGGFAQTNFKTKSPFSYNRQWVDYPIIGNPNNHNNVAMLFSRVILASKKHSFKKYRFKKHPNLNIQRKK
jgi:hypothetical protein